MGKKKGDNNTLLLPIPEEGEIRRATSEQHLDLMGHMNKLKTKLKKKEKAKISAARTGKAKKASKTLRINNIEEN